MGLKVFKLPDGKGGTRYQIQSPEGRWIDTDAEGNPLVTLDPVPAGESSPPSAVRPKKKTGGKKGRSFSLTVRMSAEEYKAFSDYVHWRCISKESTSRTQFALGVLLDAVRKDRDYREYLRLLGKD